MEVAYTTFFLGRESVFPSLSVSKQLSLSDVSLLLGEELLAGRGQCMSTRLIEGREENDDSNADDDEREDNNGDNNQSRLER
jgi:hypothetical protein